MMIRNFSFKKIFGMFFVFLFLLLSQFFLVSSADACNDECGFWQYCNTAQNPAVCSSKCGSVGTSNVFKVINNNGRECMRVDVWGNIWFSNYPVFNEEGLFDQSGRDEFIVGGPTNTLLLIDSEDCATFFRGDYNEFNNSITVGTGEFVIKNSGGVNVAKIDSEGNLYARGRIAQGCSCEEGTYSNPVNVRGNTVLHYSSWGSDYKYGEHWCRIHKGCSFETSVYIVDNDQNSCRCALDGFGCFSSSCTTSSSGWNRFSSISCGDHCYISSDCASGEYCSKTGECLDLPLCAEANFGVGYNPQELNEDIYNECSTNGCGTGYCNGNYGCGYYTSNQHNCGDGMVCDSSGECIFPSECTLDSDCQSKYYGCNVIMECQNGMCCTHSGGNSYCPPLICFGGL